MSGDLEKGMKFRFIRFNERAGSWMHRHRAVLYTAVAALFFVFLILITSCQSVKPAIDTSKTDSLGVDVQQAQTEIATGTHDLNGTIGTLKETTDTIKDGVATKEQTATIIKYVNTGSDQVKSLTGVVDKQTKQLAEFQKSRVQDNATQGNTISALYAEVDSLKPWQGRFWQAVAVIVVILVGIAGYVVLRIKGIFKI
jgi:hypothetical protein